MTKLYPLFSGSKGNSYFVGTQDRGILIDAGKNCKQLCMALEACNISVSSVKAILITHEHTDHIGAVKVFAKKYGIPVYCSKGTYKAIEKKEIFDSAYEVHVLEQGKKLAGLTINHFRISHDCAEGIGFRITTKEHNVLSFATDLGFLSETVKENLLGSTVCVIESNHDTHMLEYGSYTRYLKDRIFSEIGHLSNQACSEFLPELVESGTKKIMLAHLSEENNTVSLANGMAHSVLKESGYVNEVDYKLYIAMPRNSSGKAVLIG